MRRTLSVLAVVAVVAAAGIAGTATALNDSGAATAQESSERTITVSGQGSASAAPDEAVVRVAVVVEGDDPSAVRDDLAAGVEDLRGALADARLDGERLETEHYRIEEPHRHRREGSGPAYRGTHGFEVRVDDTDRVGTVVDAAAGAGARIEHVTFTLSEDSRDELRDRALEDAMGDARGQADIIADAGGLRVSGVGTVDATDRRYRPVRLEAAAAGGDGGGTAIESGDVSVSVRVQVTYEART